jgi:cobalt-zinc-cadmium efflux system protein
VHAHADADQERAFLFGLVAATLVLAVEVAGGILGRSLALFADAGHIFADTLSLLLALFAERQSRRSPTPRMTFGYHRANILVALLNGLVLVALAVGLAVAAVGRLLHPVLPQPGWMGGSAALALVLNVAVAARLFPHRHDLSARSVFLHYLSSVGVVAAAAVIAVVHLSFLDPLVSLLIAAFMVRTTLPILREAVGILMEATPAGLDLEEVARTILTTPGIRGVHDLHVWNLGEHQRLITCHVLIDDMPVQASQRLLQELSATLARRFAIDHATFQLETPGFCVDDECRFTISTGGHGHG